MDSLFAELQKKKKFFSNVKKNIDISICDCTLMWCSSVEWAGIIRDENPP